MRFPFPWSELGGDASSHSALWGQPLDSASMTSPEMQPRNLYWVPVRRKHHAESSGTSSTYSKREIAPRIDARSTAGVIAAVVLLVVSIMAVMVFFIWRHSRYQSKVTTMKREVSEVVKESDARQEMVVVVSDATALPTGGDFVVPVTANRSKSMESGRIRQIASWKQLHVQTTRSSANVAGRSTKTEVPGNRNSISGYV